MSGLFSSLTMSARALDAQRVGLEVTGQNIANVNTPGYARRVVDLASVPGATRESPGTGVAVQGVRAIRDSFLERRVQQEVPAEGRDAALAEILQATEVALGGTGASLDASLSEFFGAFARLAESPQSAVARAQVLDRGQALAGSFQQIAARLSDAQRAADTRARSTVEQINALADQIATLNRSLGSGTEGAKLHVADQQATLIRDLSELVDVDVLQRPQGGVDITFGNGRALVVAERSYAIETTSGPPSGFITLQSGGRDVTAEVTSGRLGGALAARDVNLPGYLSRLDEIAFEVADEVNALHAAGFDQDGNTGQGFFAFSVAPVGVAGAARALIVDPAVAADARRIAAAGVAEAGDNTAAQGIASLRDARVLDGNSATLIDGWSSLTYRVGRDARVAIDGQKTQSEIVRQIDALRDSVEGVSLDEEAMQMLKFQRAYEANARFFRVIDQTLDVLFQIVRA